MPGFAEPEIVLDLSRLLSRVLHSTPTGVDRVEMAYARGLLDAVPTRLAFGAVHPLGGYGRIPSEAAMRFLDRVSALWDAGRVDATSAGRYRHASGSLWATRPRPIPLAKQRRIFLQTSPHHLINHSLVSHILAREHAWFACMLHDLIPITHPEYARPGGADLHLRRIQTIAATADAIIANSQATLTDFAPYLEAAGRSAYTVVAHLGVDEHRASLPLAEESRKPYFVCLGTIEPRKNHLLLLNLWRDLANNHGPDAVPKLILIGRRGWENEQIVDMLERCPALQSCVEEHSGLTDARMRAMLSGARALLLPSFAEGFGMPVPEALTRGIPVICSDLPALREAGGDAPDYLDPLDGEGWRHLILDYAADASERRTAQIRRIARWTGTSWREHLAKVLDLLHRLAA